MATLTINGTPTALTVAVVGAQGPAASSGGMDMKKMPDGMKKM